MTRPSAPVRRCRRRLLPALFALLAASTLPAAGHAAVARVYPQGSMRGLASFGTWPDLTVNCTRYQLGPGLQVRDVQQRLILRGNLPGLNGPAVFQRDASGLVFRVWMVDPHDPVLATLPAAPGNCLFLPG